MAGKGTPHPLSAGSPTGWCPQRPGDQSPFIHRTSSEVQKRPSADGRERRSRALSTVTHGRRGQAGAGGGLGPRRPASEGPPAPAAPAGRRLGCPPPPPPPPLGGSPRAPPSALTKPCLSGGRGLQGPPHLHARPARAPRQEPVAVLQTRESRVMLGEVLPFRTSVPNQETPRGAVVP